jgi:hypothetical protein
MKRCVWFLSLGVVFTLSTAQAGDKHAFFNGKNLDGFEGLIDQFWSVKDGAIVGTGGDKTIPFNTFLCSKHKYRDFEMSFQIRLKGGKGNSGIQIRSRIHDQKKFAVTGPQADIGEGYWGSLYGENFGGMMKQADAKAVNAKLKKDDFNDYYIKCVGKHVTIKVNDVVAVDDDFAKMPEDGIIAFQIHGGHVMEVTFKNIHFKELK